jgi:hypothetical protein
VVEVEVASGLVVEMALAVVIVVEGKRSLVCMGTSVIEAAEETEGSEVVVFTCGVEPVVATDVVFPF